MKKTDIPIYWYDKNGADHLVKYVCKTLKPMKQIGTNGLCYAQNKKDEGSIMFIIEDKIQVIDQNALVGEIGDEFTYFEFLSLTCFKGVWSHALDFIKNEFMEENDHNGFFRVKDGLYKEYSDGTFDSFKITTYRPIVGSKNFEASFNSLPVYTRFDIFPDNINYQRNIDGAFNIYQPFQFKPANEEVGADSPKWEVTRNFLKHIFGEQYSMGIEYMKTLYENPRQILPILVLGSEERETGKTTFIEYISKMFGNNTVTLQPRKLKSQFNSAYTEKNIIIFEESKISDNSVIEIIKSISTAKEINMSKKFMNDTQIKFFGKIIMTTNDVMGFAKIDSAEIRFWIRQIKSISGEKNHNIVNDMIDEVPYFLSYLSSLPKIKLRSRMVFSKEEIATEQLKIIVENSKDDLWQEIIDFIDSFCVENNTVESFFFSGKDLYEEYFKESRVMFNVSPAKITKCIKASDNNNLFKYYDNPKEYYAFASKGTFVNGKKRNRPFEYKNPYYGMSPEEIENTNPFEDVEGVPF